MALRLPTPEDLHQLAADNYFELNQEELDAFQELIPRLFHSYELLERMPVPWEPLVSWGRWRIGSRPWWWFGLPRLLPWHNVLTGYRQRGIPTAEHLAGREGGDPQGGPSPKGREET